MNSKTILSLVGQTIFSLVIVSLAVYIFGILAFGADIKSVTANFIEVLPFMIPFLLPILFAFHYVNYRLLVKKQAEKIYPYFLYTILIPTIVSGIMSVILMYILKHKFSLILILNHMATAGAIILFLAFYYYIKNNYSGKDRGLQKITTGTKTSPKEILLYIIGLSLLNCLGQSIMLFSFYLYDVTLVFVDSVILAIICWFFVQFFNRHLEKKLSSSVLIVITIIGIVICMQPIITALKYLQIYLMGYKGIPFTRFAIIDLIRFNLLQSIYLIFCVLFYQFLYFSKTRSAEQKAFKAAIGKQTEKYNSLRRQLSPHFLFNNINVLTALIEENPQKAVRFSESLGNIYRHFLRQEDEDVVSLQSALSFSKDYLELLKYRYEEAFQYVLPETVASNQYIIPLALQQVIENTIKHNEVSKEKPLQITIGIQDDYIIIQNTKQLKTAAEKIKGTGIENIRKRYAFLTEKEVIIEDEANSFTIKLPLLNMENA